MRETTSPRSLEEVILGMLLARSGPKQDGGGGVARWKTL